VLDEEGETMQTVVFEKRRAQDDDDESEYESESESEVSDNDQESEGGDLEEFVEFLDDFVVPDGTIEMEDDTASLRSPLQAGEGRSRRRRVRMREERSDEDDDDVQAQLMGALEQSSAPMSRRSFLDGLASQRRRYLCFSHTEY